MAVGAGAGMGVAVGVSVGVVVVTSVGAAVGAAVGAIAGVGSGVAVASHAPVVSSEIAAANTSNAKSVGVVIARLEMVFPRSLRLGRECSLDDYGGASRL